MILPALASLLLLTPARASLFSTNCKPPYSVSHLGIVANCRPDSPHSSYTHQKLGLDTCMAAQVSGAIFCGTRQERRKFASLRSFTENCQDCVFDRWAHSTNLTCECKSQAGVYNTVHKDMDKCLGVDHTNGTLECFECALIPSKFSEKCFPPYEVTVDGMDVTLRADCEDDAGDDKFTRAIHLDVCIGTTSAGGLACRSAEADLSQVAGNCVACSVEETTRELVCQCKNTTGAEGQSSIALDNCFSVNADGEINCDNGAPEC
ncbi:hypothetical protein C8R46DRAFT_1140622, partial [Mycena filopes]